MPCRFNKHVKNLVRNNGNPEAHLANSATADAAARFVEFAEANVAMTPMQTRNTCFLLGAATLIARPAFILDFSACFVLSLLVM